MRSELFILVVVVLQAACGEEKRPDMGACVTVDQNGREYWLCEKANGRPPPRPEPVQQRVDEGAHEQERAERMAREAQRAAALAQEDIAALEREANDMIGRINGAIDAVTSAQTDAERAAAKVTLKSLQRDQAALDEEIAAAKGDVTKAARRVAL